MDKMKEELARTLKTLRPLVTWPQALDAAGLVIEEVWRQEQPDSWPMHGPPEDYALPPLMHWGDDLHRLAEAAYHETFGKLLEPDDRHVVEWPPTGSLFSDGAWGYSQFSECSEHGEDRLAGCAECQKLTDTIVEVVHAPAVWSWKVTVRRVLADSAEDDDVHDWDMGVTEVEPWTVEYCTYDDGAHGADLVTTVSWVVEEVASNPTRVIDSSSSVDAARKD